MDFRYVMSFLDPKYSNPIRNMDLKITDIL